MKKSIFNLAVAIMILFFPGLFSVGRLAAQADTKGLKIGVYDSRVIVFAYSRSQSFQEHLNRYKQQSDSALLKKDSVRYRELSIQMMSYQHLLHQMVFGTGSASDIMGIIKDKLPELARQQGVSLIVSKYELPFKNPSIETVDLTMLIANLFHPAGDIGKMADDIKKAQPVPLEELSIEKEMLDGYAVRFGKK